MARAATVTVDLEGVEETLLIPLWARAMESRRPDAIFQDEHAEALVTALDYDFHRFNVHDRDGSHKTAIPVRTELLDRAVRAFLAKYPDATVINLGAGLDTRFFRLDNGRVTWYEVDLPRPMALRRQLLPASDRHRTIEGSVLEDGWLEALEVRPGSPVMVVAEGLLMYLRPSAVRSLVERLSMRLPGAEMLFETLNPYAVWRYNMAFKRNGILGIKASLNFGIWSGRELESWVEGLRWIEEWYYVDHHPERWSEMTSLLRFNPIVRTMLRIEHVRLPAAHGAHA